MQSYLLVYLTYSIFEWYWFVVREVQAKALDAYNSDTQLIIMDLSYKDTL